MSGSLASSDVAPRAASTWSVHGEALTTALCALIVLAGWLASRADAPAWLVAAIFLAAYVVGGYRQAVEGTTTLLREHELDVDLLMVVAAIGAAAIGFWSDGALLILIFSLSGTLEGYASRRTKRDIEALMSLRPDLATAVREGGEVTVPASSLVVGDTVVVRPGERIAADGEIIEGASSVDQATITGESRLIEKTLGDEVFASSVNGLGALRLRVTRAPTETVLARIIALVEEAEERRPPAQLFLERFERHYAKVVVAFALFLAVVPPLALGWTFRAALYRAMIFLVVASPCALAAAMMPALLSALSNGARHGVLFKGSHVVEVLGRVGAVAFDKTGTLTTGTPQVTDVVGFGDLGELTVLARAAAIESRSEHPLGEAMVREARRRGVAFEPGIDHRATPGKGASATLDGVRWWVGKPLLFDLVEPALLSLREQLEASGKTVVIVGTERGRGLIAMKDTLRPEAPRAIARLRALGVAHLVMLTGDAEPTARAIAEQAGIDEFHAELMPEDKVRRVEQLVREYGRVAMVGDGVNDAPALAVASVGIAMGHSGTDVALEAADVVLTGDDLTKVAYAVTLGRRALVVVKQNLAFALAVIVSLVAADLAGVIDLPRGVVGHEGSTLLVTLNGLRLLRGTRSARRPSASPRG